MKMTNIGGFFAVALLLLVTSCTAPTTFPEPFPSPEKDTLKFRVIQRSEMMLLEEVSSGRLQFLLGDEVEELEREVGVGTIIVSAYEPLTAAMVIPPQRVKGKAIADGHLMLETEPATLQEALQAAEVKDGVVTLDLVPEQTWTIIDTEEVSIYSGLIGPVEVRAAIANLKFQIRNPTFLFRYAYSSSGEDLEISFSGDIEANFTPELRTSAGLKVGKEVSLLPVPPSYVVSGTIGPVPVVLIVSFQMEGGINFETEGAIIASVEIASSPPFNARVTYDNQAHWQSSFLFDPLDGLQIGEPQVRFGGDASVTFEVTPTLSARLYGVAGPSWDLLKYSTTLAFTPMDGRAPCWEIVNNLSSEFSFIDVGILGETVVEAGTITLFDQGGTLWSQRECGPSYDGDRDGYTPAEGDCDDSQSLVNPAVREICGNAVDDNCDGRVDEDCEVCDGVDNDNDGLCDEGNECCAFTEESQACGLCGQRRRVCSGSCRWGEWGACNGEGVCAPGAAEACTQDGRPGTKKCSPDCQWGPCIASCTDECSTPGESRCSGNSAVQNCTWNQNGCLAWSAPLACQAGALCQAGRCICASHAYYRCHSGNIFWYDSCGGQEDMKERCSYGCVEGSTACSPPPDPTCLDLCQGRQCGQVSGGNLTCNCGTCPSENICQNFQCVPRCEANITLSASWWEDFPSGCDDWLLSLNVAITTGSLHCRAIYTSRESAYGSSAYDVNLSAGSRTVRLSPGCCLSPTDEIIAVFVCECSGTAYINSHQAELLFGGYDQTKILFYLKETHSCNN